MSAVKGKIFYEALKDRYKEEFEIASLLDGKANNMITISSAVGTLLFGFGTFFIDKLHVSHIYSVIISAILITGILLNIFSMITCVTASRIQKYSYATNIDAFFTKKESSLYVNEYVETYNANKITKFKEISEERYYDVMIKNFFECIKNNRLLNDSKAHKIKTSQTIFSIGLSTILALAILLLSTANK